MIHPPKISRKLARLLRYHNPKQLGIQSLFRKNTNFIVMSKSAQAFINYTLSIAVLILIVTSNTISQVPNSLTPERLEEFNKSNILWYGAQQDSAIRIWEKLINDRDPNEVDSVLMRSYVYWLSNKLEYENSQDSSLSYLADLKNISTEKKFAHYYLFYYHFSSISFRNRGEHWEASLHLDSLKQFIDRKENVLSTRHNNYWNYRYNHGRAMSYAFLREFDLSLQHFEDCNKYIDQYTYRFDLIRSEMNISYTKLLMGRSDDIEHLDLASQMCDESPEPIICDIVAINLADRALQRGDHLAAQNIITEKFDSLGQNSLNGQHKLSFLRIQGRIAARLGQFEKAQTNLAAALDISKTENTHVYTYLLLEDLSKLNEELGNFAKSLNYQKELKIISDNINDQNLKNKITYLEYERDKAKTNEKISLLKKNNEQINSRRLVWLFGFLLMTAIALGLVALYFLREYKLDKLKATLEKNMAVSRLQALTMNMNPHFIFNSFNTLINFIIKEKKEDSISHVTQMSGLIRGVIKNSKTVGIALDKEISLIQSYIDLEKKRFDFDVKFILEIEETLKEINPIVPSMILQPHLENAFVHGFSSQSVNPTIRLKISKFSECDCIQCVISDNGVGRSQTKKENTLNHLGMATANTQQRLELLKSLGYTGLRLEINDLVSSDGRPIGTEVQIDLPFLESELAIEA